MKEFEERLKIGLWLDLPKQSLIACKRFLFENGISLQELFCHVIVLVENKDPRIKTILEEAKKNKFSNNKKEYVFTNSKSLYAILESKNPLKDRGQ